MSLRVDVAGTLPITGRLHGFTPADLRRLELHEAQAHGRSPRRVVDLGDTVLLHDPAAPDPFLNRLSGLRLPQDGAAFDMRLTELLALFASLSRQPHIWLSAGFGSPGDAVQRLRADGFVDVGGVYAMTQVRAMGRPTVALPPRTRIVRLRDSRSRRASVIRGAACVLVDAFSADPATNDEIVADLAQATSARSDVCLLTVGGRPVATGRRYTADGVTYLSSIGTRSGEWGKGFASALTAALIDDGRAAGGPRMHLAVEVANTRAQGLYRGLGFEILGQRRADLLFT